MVPLNESSEVLDVILQYVYPSPPCRLDDLSFAMLYQVVEAAEKYQIFAVMELGRVLLQCVVIDAYFERALVRNGV